jgi:hypothetical protein
MQVVSNAGFFLLMDIPQHTILGERVLAFEQTQSNVTLFVHPKLHYPYIYAAEIDSLYLDSNFWSERVENACTLYGVGVAYTDVFSHEEIIKVTSTGGLFGTNIHGTVKPLSFPLDRGYYLIANKDGKARVFMAACLYKQQLRPASRVHRAASKLVYFIEHHHLTLDGDELDIDKLHEDVRDDILELRARNSAMFKTPHTDDVIPLKRASSCPQSVIIGSKRESVVKPRIRTWKK